MSYQFGKALAGGTPVDDRDVRRLRVDQLYAMYDQLQRPARTEDVLDQRLAEELAHSERRIELVKQELRRRGGMPQAVRQLDEVKAVIDDVAGVVEARDRCEGVARVSPAVKRRLLRTADDSDVPLCRRGRGNRR